MIQLDIELIFV